VSGGARAADFDSTAETYDRFMGRWSALWVPALLAAAHVTPNARVLDVAAGTGQASAGAVGLVGPGGRVLTTDVSLPMLRAARARVTAPGTIVAAMDGQRLAVRDESMDAVVSMLGLMFLPDPAAGLAEFRRVLRPGGRTAVAVWAEPERAPFPGIVVEVFARHLPALKSALEIAFGLADEDHLETLFRDLDYEDVVVARESRAIKFEGFEDFWDPIEAGGTRAAQAWRELPELTRLAVREEMRARLARFATQSWLVMDCEVLITSGRR
jgi:ubiquinone/menaquinone biosynthesis C-methylase UbiE